MWCYQICRGPGTIVDIHWMLLMFRNGSPNWRSLFTESHFPGWVGRRISGSFHFLSGCDRRLFFSARPKAAHFVPQKVIPQPRQRTERQYEIGDPHAQGCERHSVVCTQKQWCKYITYSTSLCSIRVVLHPDPARLRTTERTLSHTWLTSFTAPTEQDLCGLRENFDPRARWRNAVGTARAMSRFAKCDGVSDNKKDQLALGSDAEDDIGSQSRSPSLCAAPEPDPKSQQQHISPPSLDGHTLRGRVVGLGARGGEAEIIVVVHPMSQPGQPILHIEFKDTIRGDRNA